MRKSIYLLLILLASLLLAACSEQETPRPAAKAQGGMRHPIPKITEPPKRDYKFSDVVQGGKLFQQNCASCHGPQAQGHPQWRQPMVPGKPTAPPLNGKGHSWHHPKAGLRHTIQQGTVREGGNMPSWKGKLTDAQIEQTIAWIQSRWPDEIYAAWLITEERARLLMERKARNRRPVR